MKNTSKIFVLAILILAVAQGAFAIEHTVGLRIGRTYPLNDFNKEGYSNNIRWMGGLSYEAWLKDWVSVGAYPYYTKLETEADSDGAINKANVIGAELQARFRPTKLAVLDFESGPLKRIYPYAQIGLGAAHVNKDNDMNGKFAFMVPTVGLGVTVMSKWNVSLDLGAQFDHMMGKKAERSGGMFNGSVLMPYAGLSYTFGSKNDGRRGPRRNKISMDEDFTLDGVQFEFGSNKLTEGAQLILDEVVIELKKHPKVKIEIQGHTDNVGKADYNMQLSQERADAVKDYIVAQGIEDERIETSGFGDTKPYASNNTEEGRALNRRIDFVIVK